MLMNRIEINPAVMLGKPVIRGTRIPVELILRKLADGMTEAELLDAYPRLTHEDIQTRWPTKPFCCNLPDPRCCNRPSAIH